MMAVEVTSAGGEAEARSVDWRAEADCPPSEAQAESEAWEVDVVSGVSGGIPYGGAYEVTPSSQPQMLPTASRVLARDIVVNPIPSNYGLVTWDGSTLTVS